MLRPKKKKECIKPRGAEEVFSLRDFNKNVAYLLTPPEMRTL